MRPPRTSLRSLIRARAILILALALGLPLSAQAQGEGGGFHEFLPCDPEFDPECGGGGGGAGSTSPGETFFGQLDQEPFLYPDVDAHGVVLSNGEFVHQVTDLRIPGRGFDFEFVRTYRSRNDIETVLGKNWNFNYNQRMVWHPDGNGSFIEWIRGESWSDVFTWNATLEVWESFAGFAGRVTRNPNTGQVTLRTADGIVRRYADDGHLTSITDRHGNQMEFFYIFEDQIDFVIDTMGRRIEFLYDANNRLEAIEDFSGRRVTYIYNNARQLTEVRSPLLKLSVTQPNSTSLVTRYTYRASSVAGIKDNLETIVDRRNAEVDAVRLTYGESTSQFSFDRVIRQRLGEQAQEIQYDYLDQTFNPTQYKRTFVTDRNGNVVEHHFDTSERLVKLIQRNNPTLVDGDSRDAETQYEYCFWSGRLRRVIYPEGNETQYHYEGAGSMCASTGEPVSNLYRQNNVTRIVEVAGPRGDGEGGAAPNRVTEFTFDPIYNELRSRTDAAGSTWSNTFDYEEISCSGAARTALVAYAQEWDIEIIGASNPVCGLGDVNNDGVTTATKGDVVRRLAPAFTQPNGSVVLSPETGLQYNTHGQVTKTIDPGGFVTSLEYYPETKPHDGVATTPDPSPSERDLDTLTGGYLKTRIVDAVDEGLSRPANASPAPTRLQTDLVYDSIGSLIQVTDPRGVVSTMEVNPLGVPLRNRNAMSIDSTRNVEALAPQEVVIEFDYDANLNLLERREPASPDSGVAVGVTRYEYNTLNHRIKQRVKFKDSPAMWNDSWFDSDASENLTRTVSAEGRVTFTEYDDRHRPFRMTSFADQISPPGPGANPAVGASDEVSQVFYDLNGAVLSAWDRAANGATPQGDSTLLTRNGFGEVVHSRDPGCGQVRRVYDVRGLVTSTEASGPTEGATPQAPSCLASYPLLSKSETTYDELGRPKVGRAQDFRYDSANPPNLIPNEDGWRTEKIYYDARGLAVKAVDDRNGETLTEFDGAGRATRVQLPRAVDPNPPGLMIDTQVTALSYNATGQPLTSIRTETASAGVSTAYPAEFGYDALGRMTTAKQGTGSSALTSTFNFDLRGNPLVTTNPTGAQEHRVYDARDRVIVSQTHLKVGSGAPQGNFSNLDGLITIQFAYTGDGLVSGRADDRDMGVHWTYDGLGRALTVSYPDDTHWTGTYSPEGNLLTGEVNRTGQGPGLRTTMAYDHLNRMTQRQATILLTTSNLTTAPGVSLTQDFEYDGLGRLTRATDNNSGLRGPSEVLRAYDSLGRMLEESQNFLGQNRVVTSSYDNSGFRKTLTHPVIGSAQALTETYTADAAGRLRHVAVPGVMNVEYRYAGMDRALQRKVLVTSGTTIQRDLTYDTFGRWTGQTDTHQPSGALVAGFQRAFDDSSNPLWEKYLHRPSPGAQQKDGRIFVNDPLGRIKETQEGVLEEVPGQPPTVPIPSNTWRFTLDGMGNWSEHNQGVGARRTEANGMNFYSKVDQVETFPGSWTEGRTQENDLLGNLHHEEQDGFDLYFHHDGLGRLVAMSRKSCPQPMCAPTGVAEFAYDALGRRIEMTVPFAERQGWVYDGWRMIDEVGFSNITRRDNENLGADRLIGRNYYGRGLDEILLAERDVSSSATGVGDGELERILPVTDFLGSTEQILDAETGSSIESYRYTPYGERTIFRGGEPYPASAYGYRIGFTGHRMETYSLGATSKSLAYARYRFYEPDAGRFVQRDPIGLAGGPNVYEYVGGQPATFTDPWGLSPEAPHPPHPIGPCPEPQPDYYRMSMRMTTGPYMIGGGAGSRVGTKIAALFPYLRQHADDVQAEADAENQWVIIELIMSDSEKAAELQRIIAQRDSGDMPHEVAEALIERLQLTEVIEAQGCGATSCAEPTVWVTDFFADWGETLASPEYMDWWGENIGGPLMEFAAFWGLGAAVSPIVEFEAAATASQVATRAIVAPRSLGAAARSAGPVIQSGGRTIRPATARALNQSLGESLHARQWGRALEELKAAHGLSNDFHGKITSSGHYLDRSGNIIDNLLSYLP